MEILTETAVTKKCGLTMSDKLFYTCGRDSGPVFIQLVF